MTFASLKSWIRQPTTIMGIAAILATMATTAANYLSGNLTLASAAGAVVFGVVNVILPDNSAVAKDAEKLAIDVAGAATAGLKPQTFAPLVLDTEAFLKDVTSSKTLT